MNHDGTYRFLLVASGLALVAAVAIRLSSGATGPVATIILSVVSTASALTAAALAPRRPRAVAGAHRVPDSRIVLFDRAIDLLFVAHFDGALTLTNPAWGRVLGYEPNELTGVGVFAYVGEGEQKRVKRALRRLAAGNPLRDFEVLYTTKSGEQRWVSWNIFPVTTQETLVGVGRDVTATRRYTSEAIANEEKLRIVTDFTFDWEFWLSTDHRYLFVSPACRRISGYEREDFYANPSLMYSILHPDDRDRYIKAHMEGQDGRIDVQVRIIRRDGEIRWVNHSCQPITASDGRDLGRRGSNTDTTEQRRSDEREAQLQRSLRQAQKMEALGTLAGGIAHDFNNVLAAITGYSQVSLLKLDSGEDIRQNLEEIVIAAKRGAGLVEQILTFSHRRHGEKRTVWLNTVCKEALRLVEASQPPSIRFEASLSDAPLIVEGDPSELHQIVTNVCTNAVQALDGTTGVVRVSLAPVDLTEERIIQSGVLPHGRYGVLDVRDTGRGIAARDLDRVFDPFFTTKQVGRGTGLGLSIVLGIATSYGGGVEIESSPGEGTTVRVYLPVHDRGEPSPEPKATAAPTGEGEVVFVDDEEHVLRTGMQIVESLGYTVHPFSNADEALAYLRDHAKSVSIVVADYIMPERSGIELSKALRRIDPRLPIVLCTGYGANLTEEERQATGIQGILRKPVFRDEFARALKRYAR